MKILTDIITFLRNSSPILIILYSILGILLIIAIIKLIKWIRIKIMTRSWVKGKVIKKEIKESYLTLEQVDGDGIRMPVYHPVAYTITVQYDDLEEIFDNRSLFNQYKINDQISLRLIKKFDKNGKVIHQKLELPE